MSSSSDLSARRAGLSPDKLTRLQKWMRGEFKEEAQAQTIPRRAHEGPAPVSYNQQRLWFIDQLIPGNVAYNIPIGARLKGPLDRDAFERAVGEIIRRHEVLRTTFAVADGRPVQVIHPPAPFTLPVIDLAAPGSGAGPATAAHGLMKEEAGTPFNLERGPLIRVKLLRLAADEHVFLATVHHTVTDGWSWANFYGELTALYDAFAAGQPSPLPELPIQYADFAIWQREWLKGDLFDAQLSWWRRQLSGDLPVLDLPSDRPRPPAQSFRGKLLEWTIPAEVSRGLKALSRREGATLFMTLLAAFKALTYRYTGQTDILVGTPIANRSRPEVERLIGFFVSAVVVRTDLSGDPTFRELLARVRDAALGAYDHQDLPFEQLVEVLQPPRDQSRAPLFQVMFILQNPSSGAAQMRGVTMTPIEVHSGATKFDMTLSMTDTEKGLLASFEFATDLFDDSTIARMFEHLQNILAGVVADPDRRLSALPLLGEMERRRMLVDWNDTARDYPYRLVHDLFAGQAGRTPDAVAVTFEGRQALTYRELARRSSQLARHLQKLGVGPETLVGMCVERSLEMVVGVMGVLKAGGAYLPLDPTYPKDRLQFMLEDAAAPVLLTQQHLLPVLPEHGARVICLDAAWDEIARESAAAPPCAATPENLAYVIYTSGSTGKPKGVLIEHHAVANFIASTTSIFEVTPKDRILQFASLCFDVSVFEIFTALLSGAMLVLGGRETLLSPPALTQLMKEQGVTITDLPPAMMPLLPAEEFAAERIVFVGGEAFSGDLVNRWALPGRHFYNGYGPTESTVTMTLKECTGTWTGSPPIGTPMPNHQVYILDKHLNPVPIGVPGEMYIGGVGLARGYLNRPDLTAETFIADPFGGEAGARLYKSGDLARYLPNGDVDFLGRVDTQVKIRGFRIELGEVEVAISRHPAVKQAVVVARQDAPGTKRLIAYLLCDAGAEPTVSEMRGFLGQGLPAYMVPAAFVMLTSFPMTGSGKVDHRALPVPEPERPALDQEFVAPRSPTEQVLADEVFAAVLGIEHVGVDDNFFELGGNSLQATQLISRVRTTFNVDIPLGAIFAAPTVAGLAQAVEAALRGGAAAADHVLAPITYDLEADAVLEDDLQLEGGPYEHRPAAARVLLTGATGFIGAFMLAELLAATKADVYCLIRAADEADGVRRIRDNLASYMLWDDAYASRVVPVIGDLARARLGLSDADFGALAATIDAIYHCGARVNYVLPYPQLKPANVGGTREVIRLAMSGRPKPVNSMSSLAVFAPEGDAVRSIREHDDPRLSAVPPVGYSQTKWVAERLLRAAGSRGLPVCIYRLGRVWGHSQTGACQAVDFMWLMVKGCIQFGAMPDLPWAQNLIPVDYLAKAIVYLSLRRESLGKTFHMFHPVATRFKELTSYAVGLGYKIRTVPYEEWLDALKREAERSQDNALYPMLSGFGKLSAGSLTFECLATLDALAGAPFTYPAVDSELLGRYFSYFMRTGFLGAPAGRVEA
jgi:amino acid adenylation domain-containing protein/thioester reductase-like protein